MTEHGRAVVGCRALGALAAGVVLLLLPRVASADAARAAAPAAGQITVTLSPHSPGATIPPDFAGLSYEATSLVPDAGGHYLFSETNLPLLGLYRTLGIRSLRVGGNSSERATTNPGDADRANLFRFAEAGNVGVIFNLRMSLAMSGANPADQAAQIAIAQALIRDFNNNLQCLELANEPDHLIASETPDHPRVTYKTYNETIQAYLAAITAGPRNARNTMFCGPSTTGKGAPWWPARFAADYQSKGRIAFVTQHWYPGGDASAEVDPARVRDKLLSPAIHDTYQAFHDIWVPPVLTTGLPYRLEETNSVGLGGVNGASNAFAAALWGLDYLHWWANHGAAGLNFHNGGPPAGALYAAIMPDNFAPTYEVRPLAYGIKAFDLGSRGRLVPVAVSNPSGVNLTAYGALGWDGTLYATLINKSTGKDARAASVTLSPGTSCAAGRIWRLEAPGGDVSATSGLTLGGASIDGDGKWDGKPSPVAIPAGGEITVDLPPATAAVVALSATKKPAAPRAGGRR